MFEIYSLYLQQVCVLVWHNFIQGDTKKWELLKNPTKIEEIQEHATHTG